jgi:hypothetical protein
MASSEAAKAEIAGSVFPIVLQQNRCTIRIGTGDYGGRSNVPMLVLEGNAGNEDADFVQRALQSWDAEISSAPEGVVDTRALDFCYSQVIKVMMAWLQGRHDPYAHRVVFRAGTQLWQAS